MPLSFIDPGLLRRRAALQAAEMVPDESGGAATLWHEVAEVSVYVELLVSDKVFALHTADAVFGMDRGASDGLARRALI